MAKTRSQPQPSVPQKTVFMRRPQSRRVRVRDDDIQLVGQSNSSEFVHVPRQPNHRWERHRLDFFTNQDIDMYFAASVLSNKQNKEESGQEMQEVKKERARDHQEPESIQVPQVKIEVKMEEQKAPTHLLCLSQSHPQFPQRLPSIHEQSGNENMTGQGSPIFGPTRLRGMMTTPQKFDTLKEDFDHSEEYVAKKDLIDQLEEKMDVCESEKMDVEKRDQSRDNEMGSSRKKYQKGKEMGNEDSDRTQNGRKSVAVLSQEERLRRLASIVKLPVLMHDNVRFEKVLRLLKIFKNSLRSIMYYYKLRETSPQVLHYRESLFKVLNDEADKLYECLKIKKDACLEMMQEKMKTGKMREMEQESGDIKEWSGKRKAEG